MRIAILSPLFPPDVAIPASYVKELACRLAKEHTVCVLTYSHLPEVVPKTQVISIEKQNLLPRRLFHFFTALTLTAKQNDMLIVQNGISSELPVLIHSFLNGTPFILEVSDPKAIIQNNHSWLKRTIHYLLVRRATAVMAHNIYENKLTKPEIISFEAFPHAAMEGYEAIWQTHLEALNRMFTTHA
ncbi:MAG: hypothetical protein AUK16_02800 [Parcubacteria group bacterium CG2_30_44_11]|nr:MAG: hypothetical protein AUK16_02800 [Parcubacteria group bacterium CG2_30_44_11]